MSKAVANGPPRRHLTDRVGDISVVGPLARSVRGLEIALDLIGHLTPGGAPLSHEARLL